MATFEDQYRPNMERDEAMTLVRNAITAGILNDLVNSTTIIIARLNYDHSSIFCVFRDLAVM